MKKILFLILTILILLVTNSITHSLTKEKFKEDFSKYNSHCILNSDIDKDLEVSYENTENGLLINLSNSSKCVNIEEITFTFIKFNQYANDTISIEVNEKIKYNFEASLTLNQIKIDSNTKIKHRIKRISF